MRKGMTVLGLSVISAALVLSGCSSKTDNYAERASKTSSPAPLLAAIPGINEVRSEANEIGGLFEPFSDESGLTITKNPETSERSCATLLGFGGDGGTALKQYTDPSPTARRSTIYATEKMDKTITMTVLTFPSEEDATKTFKRLSSDSTEQCKSLPSEASSDVSKASITNVTPAGPSSLGVIYHVEFLSKLPNGITHSPQACVGEFDTVLNGIISVEVCGMAHPDTVSRALATLTIANAYANTSARGTTFVLTR